jgi:uncharacterized membrane protein
MNHPGTIEHDIIMPAETGAELPVVRAIGLDDLVAALAKGWADFKAMPTHVFFIGLIYPAIGLLLFRAMHSFALIPLLYPLAAGFALVGPFAAIGLYELSRRRELGLETTWGHAFDVLHSPSLGAILRLGLLLLAIFVAWLGVAHAMFTSRFDAMQPLSLLTFLEQVLTTPAGLDLIIWGNLIGFLFAVLAFVLSVVSFPLLLDRHVGASVAIATSFEVVRRNPLTMTAWAGIVAGLLALGALPILLGLAIVVPVLGHATWHLYRRAVEPADGARPDYDPPDIGVRYAADFPASLFTRTRAGQHKT